MFHATGRHQSRGIAECDATGLNASWRLWWASSERACLRPHPTAGSFQDPSFAASRGLRRPLSFNSADPTTTQEYNARIVRLEPNKRSRNSLAPNRSFRWTNERPATPVSGIASPMQTMCCRYGRAGSQAGKAERSGRADAGDRQGWAEVAHLWHNRRLWNSPPGPSWRPVPCDPATGVPSLCENARVLTNPHPSRPLVTVRSSGTAGSLGPGRSHAASDSVTASPQPGAPGSAGWVAGRHTSRAASPSYGDSRIA
jgi:hypothetical protein